MIALRDILDGIAGTLAKEFPTRFVYRGKRPDNFGRPSFFLQLVTTSRRRTGIGVDETEVYLTLTIHEELNVSRAGDQEAALADLDRALALFRCGVLRVQDRALPIAAGSGGQGNGEAYIDLTVTLRDGVGYDPEENLPVMEKLALKQEGKNGSGKTAG